jgi:hypothetical protein
MWHDAILGILFSAEYPPDFETPLVACLRKPPFFATQPFSHKTTRSDFIEGFGLLTVRRVRHIRALSWCPETADNRRGTKLPENHA